MRAYDIASGRQLWAQYVSRCYVMLAAPAGAFCDSGTNTEVTLLDRATGAPRALPMSTPGTVSSIERVGTKVAVIQWSSPQVQLYDAATGAAAGTLDVPASFQPLRAKDGVVCGVALGPTSSEMLCFDSSRVRWLSPLSVLNAMLIMSDERDALITSPRTNESLVVSLDDGREVARVPGMAACLVRGGGGKLDGIFRALPQPAVVDLDGHERWTTPTIRGSSARAVLAGDALILATYNRGVAGAELMAVDRSTGVTRWIGDVELLPIAHSAYTNDVQLRLVAGAVLMRGREAMQDYLELFDPQTGRRLLSTIRRR